MKQALLIVDLQNDFLPHGALEVPQGHQVIPIINALMREFELVLASKDWHPKHHQSFASTWGLKVGEVVQTPNGEQILWPDHCIQNTYGSEFPDQLDSEYIDKIFYKGSEVKVDSYSIFFDSKRQPASSIYAFLKEKNIKDLFIVGLATDYCVLETALDAKELGFRVFVVQEGCKAVNLKPQDEERAYQKMESHGCVRVQFSQLQDFLRPGQKLK